MNRHGLRVVRAQQIWIGIAVCGLLALAGGAQAEDSGWPRQFSSPSGTFVIYQPQPESLVADLLSGRIAFSLQRSPDQEPTFGVMWFTERIVIDRDSSTVAARNFDVTKVRLPGTTPADASRYEQLVESEAANWDLSGSLEELQAGLASAEKERASVADLDTVPPRIVFSEARAILVVYDGAPVLEPIAGSPLERVTNTPYAVIHDPSSRAYYLSGANLWYRADDPRGPWSVIPSPPAAVSAVVPPDTSAMDSVRGMAPLVLTATEPTELIATDGPPKYAPLVDDKLLYVTNTEGDMVREISTQQIYVLIAGRWYRAATFAGPWSFVRGDRLPASFARVPPESPKANILASVAGTDQANDAVADAEIPQTAAVRRGPSDFAVQYDGRPKFERIPGTNLKYAVNTDAEVLLDDERYYACDQGVWYVADDPDGPWQVSEDRPAGVDDIPPSCPLYDVRYVYVYDVTPTVVYCGYLPGYIGCYPYYGTVVFGTGYRYVPWRGHHYYPRPFTWGFHSRYNPWLGRWSFGRSYEMGFLRIGFLWHSGPGNRTIHDPIRWLGPGGYRRPLLEANGTMVRTRRAVRMPAGERTPMNIYRRPANVPRADRESNRVPVRRVSMPLGRADRIPNNVFAGRDGRVYRRDEAGWKVNQGRSWLPAPVEIHPAPVPGRGAGAVERQEAAPAWPPRPARWPQPMPPPAPVTFAPAAEPPRIAPAQPPAPPPILPKPGNLEREFLGRARAAAGPPPAATPPREKREQ